MSVQPVTIQPDREAVCRECDRIVAYTVRHDTPIGTLHQSVKHTDIAGEYCPGSESEPSFPWRNE